MNLSELPTDGKTRQKLFLATYGHFIGGEWVAGEGGKTIPVTNPATGELLAHIQAGTAADVGRAVEAADRAFRTWSRSHPMVRQAVLREMARRLRARLQDF